MVENVVENEAHFVLEFPLYNSIRDGSSTLFENAIPSCLKTFFQLDHQVEIRQIIPISMCGIIPKTHAILPKSQNLQGRNF